MLQLPKNILEQGKPLKNGVVSELQLLKYRGKQYVVKTVNTDGVDQGFLEELYKSLEDVEFWPEGLCPLERLDWSESIQLVMPVMEMSGKSSLFAPADLLSMGYPRVSNKPWTIVGSLSHSIASLHQQEIVHGNLKPGNIFVMGAKEIILTDLALGYWSETQTPSFSDTICYAAPELLDGSVSLRDKQAFRLDVYSFGVLAFRMLNGAFPREDTWLSKLAVSRNFDTVDKEHVISISDRLRLWKRAFTWNSQVLNGYEQERRNLIEACLSIDPLDRPRSLVEVDREFRSILKREEDQKKVEKLSKKVRRKRRTMNLLFLIALLVIGVTVFQLKLIEDQEASHNAEILEKDQRFEKQKAEIKRLEDQRISEERELLSSLNETDLEKRSYEEMLDGAWLLNTRVLGWALEDRSELLPPLESNEERLKVLNRDLTTGIVLMERHERYLDRTAEMRLLLAEVKLHLGQPELAIRLLDSLASTTVVLDKSRLVRTRLLVALNLVDSGEIKKARKVLLNVQSFEKKSSVKASVEIFYWSQLAKLELAKIEIQQGLVDLGISMGVEALKSLGEIRLSQKQNIAPSAITGWLQEVANLSVLTSENAVLAQESRVNRLLIKELETLNENAKKAGYYEMLAQAYLSESRVLVGLENMSEAESYANRALLVTDKISGNTILVTRIKGRVNQLIGESRMGLKAKLFKADVYFLEAQEGYEKVLDVNPDDWETLLWWVESTRYEAIIKGISKGASAEREILLKVVNKLESILMNNRRKIEQSDYFEVLYHLKALSHAELSYHYKRIGNFSKQNYQRDQAIALWNTLRRRTQEARYQESIDWLIGL